MGKRVVDPSLQPLFDFDAEPSSVDISSCEEVIDHEVLTVSSPEREPSVNAPELRALYVEQIIRDTKTLHEPEDYQQPSREFYEQRIMSFRDALRELGG